MISDLAPTDNINGYNVRPGYFQVNGATPVRGGINFTITSVYATSCTLLLFKPQASEPYARIPFPPSCIIGNTYSMIVYGLELSEFEYAYSFDGPHNEKLGLIFNKDKYILDPYAKAVTGQSGWGVKQNYDSVYKARVVESNYDWGNFHETNHPFEELIIYELHVRDLGTHSSSGITNVGKFLSLTERGTKTPGGMATGIDHIKELGITHIHLLPIYDFGSVDETSTYNNLFNWGYDPVNYNVPEGSYSSDPYNGEVRVAELKQMVKSLHEDGISVVMDVVYNHVYNAGEFCVNKLVPGYFSRIDDTGSYSNGSGCGNDTASERSMVKKYIVDSVNYWADEYHIDGFRFDLVGLIDTETINDIVTTVHAKHPDVIFYGEGWSMNTAVTKEGYTMATQLSSTKTPDFAYFNDEIRDAIKGHVFNSGEVGFVSGARNFENIIDRTFKAESAWCTSPNQTINYASCHDNFTLLDRIAVSTKVSREDLIRMNNLGASIYILAEGIPFMQAGEEMLRTKPNGDGTFNSNSYASGDNINSLKWAKLDEEETKAVYEYYKGLIAFRKAHAALRLSDAAEVEKRVSSVTGLDDNMVAFEILGDMKGEPGKKLFIVYNANPEAKSVSLPQGKWNVYVNDKKAGTQALSTVSGKIEVAPISAMVLVQGDGATANTGVAAKIAGGIAIAVLLAGAAVAIFKKKK